ncbi:DNAj/HSP40 [Tritrichomonas foetus]|uniref:DNAj/HSP40 n=1 Tax=Tritrichomonas foetus TaxID=1144522 RepID=A0A1J4KQE0_9EUKA|nr:DNAj/HSP40 [Tritrichomonas foetus]|eukprot:OHT13128.1 DNAj/HSP40 [Tritrichomonas foetus]
MRTFLPSGTLQNTLAMHSICPSVLGSNGGHPSASQSFRLCARNFSFFLSCCFKFSASYFNLSISSWFRSLIASNSAFFALTFLLSFLICLSFDRIIFFGSISVIWKNKSVFHLACHLDFIINEYLASQLSIQMLFLVIHTLLTYFVKKSPLRHVQQLVGFRQYKEAKILLDKMINEKKDDAEILNLRATCELNLDMVAECLSDTEIIMNSDASELEKQNSYVTRSLLYIKTGELPLAEEYALKANNSHVVETINHLKELKQQYYHFTEQNRLEDSAVVLDQILLQSSLDINLITNRTEIAWKLQDYGNYSKYSHNFEKMYPKDSKIFYRNGIALLCNGTIEESILKFKNTLQMRNPPINCSIALKLADKITKIIAKIEQVDPLNQTQRKNQIESNDYQTLIDELNTSSLKFCTANDRLTQKVYLYTARLLRFKGEYEMAFDYLSELSQKYPKSYEFVFEKADIDLELHNYDSAIETYKEIQREYRMNLHAQEKIDAANLLKKRSFYVDHYAFLGLIRDRGLQTTVQQVKDAYRKVVRHWHPDRFRDPEKKKEAERMMRYINAAYDVLSDQRKKDLYDQGKDPYNPNDGKPEEFSDRFEDFFSNPDFFINNNRDGPLHIQIHV